MPKIVFANRYFFPDHSATSQILSDLAFHLADRMDVHVITSRQVYDDPNANLPAREEIDDVTVHRVRTTQRGRTSLTGRALDYASFYAAAMTKALALVRRGDIIVAKTDPPMISVPMGWAASIRRAKLINWLQDLYPELAVTLGVRMSLRQASVLAEVRNRSLRKAALNVAIGQDMATRIDGLGVAAARIEVIPNWSDDESVHAVPRDDNPLRQEWGLGEKFIIGYSGNLGRAHEFETVLGAAEALNGDDDIRFLFVGGGHSHAVLTEEIARRDLRNVILKPYQPRDRLSQSLSVPDVHWVSLRPDLDGLLLPSKFYGIAAAGRPILVIADPANELARLAVSHECGEALDIGDVPTLVAAIKRMRDDMTLTTRMGQAARRMIDRHYSKASALAAWERVIQGVMQR